MRYSIIGLRSKPYREVPERRRLLELAAFRQLLEGAALHPVVPLQIRDCILQKNGAGLEALASLAVVEVPFD